MAGRGTIRSCHCPSHDVPGPSNGGAPVEYRINGQQLVFAAVPEMRNKDPYNYKFQVRHNQAGSQVVRAKVTSANWPVAVVKEEGTLVYNDQTE